MEKKKQTNKQTNNLKEFDCSVSGPFESLIVPQKVTKCGF